LTVYAGTDFGWGLYRSRNGGATWTNLFTSRSVMSVAVDPANPSVLYAGLRNYSSGPGGIVKSRDGGTTWASVFADPQVNSVVVDPADPRVIYAATNEHGVFRSTDAGGTWTGVGGRAIVAPVTAILPDLRDSTNLYAATAGQGMFHSVDAGTTWSAVNAGLTDLNVSAFALQPNAPYEMLAVTYGGQGFRAAAQVVTVPPPVVSAVYVRGSSWEPDFMSYMEGQNLGDERFGYRVDDKTAADVVPWSNVDEVVLRYSGAPIGVGIPVPESIAVDGVRSDFHVTSVTALDPQTFVLHIDRRFGTSPSGSREGDRLRLTVNSGGPGGADYSRTINFLQGVLRP
jgi:hypothetical protein